MVLQDDGDLVLYNKCNVSVWNTGTYRKCEKGADHFFPKNFFYFLILTLNLKFYFNIQHSSSNNLLFIRKRTLPSASSNELGLKRVTNSRSVLQSVNSKLLTGLQNIHFKSSPHFECNPSIIKTQEVLRKHWKCFKLNSLRFVWLVGIRSKIYILKDPWTLPNYCSGYVSLVFFHYLSVSSTNILGSFENIK